MIRRSSRSVRACRPSAAAHFFPTSEPVQVTATHEHGMLSVCIPKIEATESPTLKMIPVQPAKKVLQGKQEEQ